MNIRHTLAYPWLALALAALAACGGGGNTVVAVPPPADEAPPADEEVVVGQFAFGPISSFGSIIVGGVRYDTSDAQFTIDGEVGSQDDLSVGHVVLIEATVDGDGVAQALNVFFDDNIEGPIESIDLVASQLIVLGQTVAITADTSFDDGIVPPSLEGLAVGDTIEVSGLIEADGTISATRIERKAPGGELELRGVVSNLDSAAQRFDLNALTVDYSAALLSDFPTGQPTDGDLVEVKGTAFDPGGELIATSVELESLLPGDGGGGAFVEIEGFISRFASATDFSVAGLAVTTTEATVFEGGAASDLGLNIKVEVEGVLDEAGTLLTATKVDIRRARAVRVTAAVDSVDAQAGTLLVLGIPVNVDAMTRLEDKSDADVSPLTLSDLNPGDYLEVRGDEFPAGSGELRAALLEREDPDEESELQGFVTAVSEPSFTILGVTVETDGRTEYRDEQDLPITATEFFAQLAPGRLVKAEGAEVAPTTLIAEEVQFEVED